MLQYKNKSWVPVHPVTVYRLEDNDLDEDFDRALIRAGWTHHMNFGNPEMWWGMKMYVRDPSEFLFDIGADNFDLIYADNMGDAIDFIAHVSPSMFAASVCFQGGFDEEFLLRVRDDLGDLEATARLEDKEKSKRLRREKAQKAVRAQKVQIIQESVVEK